MVKKVFALASVTALAGLIISTAAAGCSSTTTLVDDGGGTDAKSNPVDSSRPDTSDPVVDSGPASCPTTDPIESSDIESAEGTWQAPPAIQSACVQGDLDKLRTAFDNAGTGGVKYTDIKTALGATCSACAFSASGTNPWGIFAGDDTNGYADNRLGSCIAQYRGAACGKAIFEYSACLDSVCPDTCTNSSACVTAAQKGACKDLATTFSTACTNLDQTETTNCGSILFSIEATCGGGPDAGLDAASN